MTDEKKPSRKRKNKKSTKRKILVLMHKSLVPPESMKGLSDKELGPVKTEYDVTSTLREMGHEMMPLGVDSDLGVLRNTMDEFNPQITFNLLEEFHGVAVYDQHVVSYLELLKRRYTGCNPRGLMLAHDKALSKQVMASHRIPVPEFVVYPMDRKFREPPRRVEYPLLVKSLTAEGSEGISQASLVSDAGQLRERTEFIHRQIGTDAIAERYVEGCVGQSAAADTADLGAALHQEIRGCAADRHREGQVGLGVPEEARHRLRAGPGSAGRDAREDPADLQAYLQGAQPLGIRPRRPASDSRGQDLRPRGQPQPRSLLRRRVRRIGRISGNQVRKSP
jgi:hypothetical protein